MHRNIGSGIDGLEDQARSFSSDSPMAADGSPQASLYYFTEESWDRFTKWSLNPTALRIGPSVFNLTFARE
ncbi:hypothetical protein Bca52824_095145 [Brassica carinata]|uniref:Uncharacterized protein n=1 Tax=Brassica carinata TaxID=52824 RepID=A0A8X7P415_BRACI|nr:hypothetical protein Bca52824_095145 [Brassica carinata]